MKLKYEPLPMIITDEQRLLRASLIIYHESDRKEANELGCCMAAAPELASACKDMLFAFGYGSSSTFEQQREAIKAAEKAVIKAKGKI